MPPLTLRRLDTADPGFASALDALIAFESAQDAAIDDTLARARHYGQRAIDAIGAFPGGAAKAALTEAVEFAIARAY